MKKIIVLVGAVLFVAFVFAFASTNKNILVSEKYDQPTAKTEQKDEVKQDTKEETNKESNSQSATKDSETDKKSETKAACSHTESSSCSKKN